MKILDFLEKRPCIVLLLLVALVSLPTLKNSFLFIDDIDLIVNNPKLVFSLDEIAAVFSKPLGQIFDPSVYSARFVYYRPALNILYMLNNTIWGINPVGFHITNLFLHLLTAIFVYRSGLILFNSDRMFSLLAASLFCVHPVHNELIGRVAMNENMLGLFVALSFYCYLQGRKKLSLLAFGAALLSKESAVMLPVALLMFETMRLNFKYAISYLKPFMVLLLCYLAVRSLIIGISAGSGFSVDYLTILVTSVSALTDYLRLLVLPYPLHIYYPIPKYTSLFQLVSLVKASICLLLGFIVWKMRSEKLLLPLLSGTIIMLVPVIFKANEMILSSERIYIAERQLYIPAIFFSLFIAGLLRMSAADLQTRKYILTGSCAIIVLLSFITAEASTVWEDDKKVYARFLEEFPESSLMTTVYKGKLLLKNGDPDMAMALFTAALPAGSSKARELPPVRPDAKICNDLSKLYRDCNILAYQPRYAEVHYCMGEVYLAKGDFARAVNKFRTALILEPNSLFCRIRLAEVYLKRRMFNEARREYGIVVNDERFKARCFSYDW